MQDIFFIQRHYPIDNFSKICYSINCIMYFDVLISLIVLLLMTTLIS